VSVMGWRDDCRRHGTDGCAWHPHPPGPALPARGQAPAASAMATLAFLPLEQGQDRRCVADLPGGQDDPGWAAQATYRQMQLAAQATSSVVVGAHHRAVDDQVVGIIGHRREDPLPDIVALQRPSRPKGLLHGPNTRADPAIIRQQADDPSSAGSAARRRPRGCSPAHDPRHRFHDHSRPIEPGVSERPRVRPAIRLHDTLLSTRQSSTDKPVSPPGKAAFTHGRP
jgi:hypothetical protein